MKLLVFSICKDEAATIGELLDRIPKKLKGINTIERWVIDDGSIDGTAEMAKKHGAHVVSDGVSKRLASRFRQATEIALSRGADIMVNIDGDLQFTPEEIPDIIKPVVAGEADFVAADRFTDRDTGKIRRPENMPAAKYWGNKLGAAIVGRLSGQKFRDVTCGFRAYNRDALYALNLHSTYTYTQESFQVLAMKRFRIVSVPVSIKYFKGRKSRVVRSFTSFLFSSGLNILRAYRDYAPLKFFGTLGNVFFVVGLIGLTFALVHWIVAGSISPYKFMGLGGLYFVSFALVVWVIGIVADMFDRMLGNQERIIERLKRLEYEKDHTKKQ